MPRRPDRAPGTRRSTRRSSGATPETLALEAQVQELSGQLEPYGLQFDPAVVAKLVAFADLLIRRNGLLNLLSRRDVDNVIRKHVAASLGVFLLVQPREGQRWIDVGTGAGFPGMILKIARPDLNIELLDSSRKRCLFLEEASSLLRLGLKQVHQLRVETWLERGVGLESYDVLTCRAVAGLSESLRVFGPLIRRGGQLVTFKGPSWEQELQVARDEGELERSGFAFREMREIPWTPGHLLLLDRLSETPSISA